LIAGSAVVLPVQAQAPQQLQVQGLAVTPFLIETTVEAGKPQEQKVTLTNTTDQPLPIDISVNDFVPNNTTGQALFLSAGEQANPAYSLSNWITVVKQPSFVIPPRQQTEVVFALNPPKDASPGTHYGGLLFSYRQKPADPGQVVVTEKVGVLVLAQLGRGNEQGLITDLVSSSVGSTDTLRFLLTFYNSGNTYLKPKGEIHITNIFGQQVASIPLNRGAQIVLPQNQRIFESLWSPGWRLGRYTATAILYYGDPKIESQISATVWIVPWTRVALVLGALIVLAYALRKLIAKYNRRILSRAGHNNESSK
jgi:hypothetical protein